jgi:hypothetical protein
MSDEIHSALLRLLRVKYVLLSLHPLNQFLDPVKKGLVGGVGRYDTVMLDLLVDLNALLAHGTPPRSHRREATEHLLSYDGGVAVLFQSNYGRTTSSVSGRCGISWVTALARCFGIELTSIGPLQSSTGYWSARRLAFPMASPSSAQINGSYPTKFPSGPTM